MDLGLAGATAAYWCRVCSWIAHVSPRKGGGRGDGRRCGSREAEASAAGSPMSSGLVEVQHRTPTPLGLRGRFAAVGYEQPGGTPSGRRRRLRDT